MKPAVGIFVFTAALVWFGLERGNRAPAQPAAPPSPTHYQVTLRYRIVAPRDQHVLVYDKLVEHLQKLKFEFDPPLSERPPTDRIDPNKNEFRGRLAAANVPKLRDNPHVAGVLLAPDGFKLPDEADKPVRVRLEIVGGLPSDRQRDLAEQTKLVLGLLGFKEAASYDHRGAGGQRYTKIMGTLPKNQLEVLLKDLRTQPGGWFAPRIAPAELPLPLQSIDPILFTEVLTDPEPIADAGEPAARQPEYLEKIGPGLWELVNDKEKEHHFVRVQALLAGSDSPEQLRQRIVQAAPSAFVEGVLGSTVTAEMTLGHAKALAALPDVLVVRLPAPARGDVDPALPGLHEPAKVLQQSGLANLHQQGKRGQKVRLAIIDSDFRGWQALAKAGKLPAATRLVDLTAERSPELVPSPDAAGEALGQGTQCALAAAVAAPAADLILIRVLGDDPHQLDDVNRYFRGGILSATLERRLNELRFASSSLAQQRGELFRERRAILDSFRDEQDLLLDFGFLGPVYGWIFSEREWHRQRLAHQDKLDQEYLVIDRRYWALVKDVQDLKGIPLAACALTWNDGFPLGAASPLSRALDAQPGGPLWFVPAGNTARQAWTGIFRDADRNGLMEFSDMADKLPGGRWTNELNFLAWQPYAGKQAEELPAKAVLHITLQWREPHDADYYLRPGEDDWYRRSLAGLTITLLRQRDPTGKSAGSDAMEIVARSPAVALRLDHQPGGSVYEQALDFVVEKPGRYALRVEHPQPARWQLNQVQDRFQFELRPGEITSGTRPVSAPAIRGVEKTWELRPRLFVDVIDATRLRGRAVLDDFATSAGGIGLPGDARSVITVGAAGLDGKPEPYSASGPPPFIDLAPKPSVWAYDSVRQGQGGAWGASLSASFAAGTAATLLSSGVNREQLLGIVKQHYGKIFAAER